MRENINFLIATPKLHVRDNLQLYNRQTKTDGNTSENHSQDKQDKNLWDSNFDSEEDNKNINKILKDAKIASNKKKSRQKKFENTQKVNL